jgi:hypothetical protein
MEMQVWKMFWLMFGGCKPLTRTRLCQQTTKKQASSGEARQLWDPLVNRETIFEPDINRGLRKMGGPPSSPLPPNYQYDQDERRMEQLEIKLTVTNTKLQLLNEDN